MRIARSRRGAGLVDVIVTIFLLCVAGIVFSSTFPGAFTSSRQAQEYKIATAIAQRELEHIRTMNYESLSQPLLADVQAIDQDSTSQPYSFTSVQGVDTQLHSGVGRLYVDQPWPDTKRVRACDGEVAQFEPAGRTQRYADDSICGQADQEIALEMKTIVLRSRRGMTVVETVIAMTIVSMAGITLLAVLSQTLSGWSTGTSQDAATSAATLAVQKLSRDIRDGRKATESGGVLTVTFPRLLTNPLTNEQSYDLSADDPVTRSYYIDYTNGNLMRKLGSASATILCRGITGPTAAGNPPPFGANGGTVTINLDSTGKIGGAEKTCRVTARVALRNFR